MRNQEKRKQKDLSPTQLPIANDGRGRSFIWFGFIPTNDRETMIACQ